MQSRLAGGRGEGIHPVASERIPAVACLLVLVAAKRKVSGDNLPFLNPHEHASNAAEQDIHANHLYNQAMSSPTLFVL